MTDKNTDQTASASQNCVHCGRTIVQENGQWIDPEATGDDAIWREVCDKHDTFIAEHEPELPPTLEKGATLDEMIAKHKAYGLSVADQPQGNMAQPSTADIDAALTRTHAKLEFARLERQELADIRQQRDAYKAHAAKLAEALRAVNAALSQQVQYSSYSTNGPGTIEILRGDCATARKMIAAALAAYEEAQS